MELGSKSCSAWIQTQFLSPKLRLLGKQGGSQQRWEGRYSVHLPSYSYSLLQNLYEGKLGMSWPWWCVHVCVYGLCYRNSVIPAWVCSGKTLGDLWDPKEPELMSTEDFLSSPILNISGTSLSQPTQKCLACTRMPTSPKTTRKPTSCFKGCCWPSLGSQEGVASPLR